MLQMEIQADDFVSVEQRRVAALARKEFFVYRQLIRPQMIWNWWAELLCIDSQGPAAPQSFFLDAGAMH